MEPLTEGTRIYYHGDMANASGFGTICKVENDKWGLRYRIEMDDGRIMKGLPHCGFSEKYLGHGGTRFVTERAYREFRAAQWQQMNQCAQRVRESQNATILAKSAM